MQIKKNLLLTFWLCLFNTALTQELILHEIVNGGVTSDCYNYYGFETNGSFNVQIPNNSTIKKAYLIYHKYNTPADSQIKLNGTTINLTTNLPQLLSFDLYDNAYDDTALSSTGIIDVTNTINTIQNNYTIYTFNQNNSDSYNFYAELRLIVLYEKTNDSVVDFSLYANNKSLNTNEIFADIEIDENIDLNEQIGFSLHANSICDSTTYDGSSVYLNEQFIGNIGGNEPFDERTCTGVHSSFNYENSIFTGLEDDIANNVMQATDGIMLIPPSAIVNDSIHFKFIHRDENMFNDKPDRTNHFLNYTIVGTSLCDTFSVEINEHEIACENSDSVQFTVAGGNAYEWKPALGLSCTDCPNPKVSTQNGSRAYTVEVWNNDTCSITRPVQLEIVPTPTYDSINIEPTLCGSLVGNIEVFSPYNFYTTQYSLNNSAFTTSPTFNQLDSGFYTLALTNEKGCAGKDTLIYVDYYLPQASFVSVDGDYTFGFDFYDFNNTSINASDYFWNIEEQFFSTEENIIFFPTNNQTYEIELIAYNNDVNCSDTAILTVNHYDTNLLIIPQAFTPNDDGTNDELVIEARAELNYTCKIYNRWGSLVLEKENKFIIGENTVWNGKYKNKQVPTGTYYYVIEIDANNTTEAHIDEILKLKKNYSGFVYIQE